MTLAALLFTGSRSNLIAAFLVIAGLVVVLATDRRRSGRAVAGAAVAALCALLVLPSLGGGGLLPLPQDAVTKLNIGLLFEQRQQQLGSGAVRSSVLDEGLGLVARVPRARRRRRQRRDADPIPRRTSPGWRTSTTGGWSCS